MVNYAKPHLSIVSPVYQGEEVVDKLVMRLMEEIPKITPQFEIVLVDDGSRDRSWEKISASCARHPQVKGIKLNRNFGQQNAITAGLEASQGDYVVVMDCDLQDDPCHIADMYAQAQKGFDVVLTRCQKRNHGWFKNATAKLYYWIFYWLSSVRVNRDMERIGAFSLISRKAVDAYSQFNDYRKAYLMTLIWLGFPTTIVPVVQCSRYAGQSSYNFSRLISLAISSSISYSDRLLYLTVYLGITFSAMAFVGIAVVVYRYYTVGSLLGWSSLIVALMFFSGTILTALGVIGLYVGYLFEQTKNRPRYVVQTTCNMSAERSHGELAPTIKFFDAQLLRQIGNPAQEGVADSSSLKPSQTHS